MRVIAGTARGTQLKTIEGDATRPTTDRVKEALFSSIQFEIRDAMCLDAFSGSGALGIEALSRGAKQVVMIDQSQACKRVIEDNLKKTKLLDRASLLIGDVFHMIDRSKALVETFDLVFLDPPYGRGFCSEVIKKLICDDRLSKNAIIVIEHDATEQLEPAYGHMVLSKQKKYGNTFVTIYREVTA